LYWGIGHLSVGSVGIGGIKELTEVLQQEKMYSQMPDSINMDHDI
jgi:hypothetical protein